MGALVRGSLVRGAGQSRSPRARGRWVPKSLPVKNVPILLGHGVVDPEPTSAQAFASHRGPTPIGGRQGRLAGRVGETSRVEM